MIGLNAISGLQGGRVRDTCGDVQEKEDGFFLLLFICLHLQLLYSCTTALVPFRSLRRTVRSSQPGEKA